MFNLTKTKELILAQRWLAFFLLLHVLLWTLGPLLFRYSLTHDTLEGIAWGSQWQLGYNKHPFLAAWFSYGTTALTHNTGWSVYLLAQLAVVLTFWAVWRLALHFFLPYQALLATLSLEGILFYNLNSHNFTPDTLQSPLWALLSLFFYCAIITQSVGLWLGVGVLAALSLVSKYQGLLLLLSMFGLLIINKQARQSFKQKGLYCAIFICLLLITPHLIWLYQHQFITINYALATSGQYSDPAQSWPHMVYPWRFITNSLLNTICLFGLLWPIYSKAKFRWAQKRTPSRFNILQWQFLLLLGLGPWFLSLVLCALSGHHFPGRWTTPYFFLLGILVVGWFNPLVKQATLKQFLVTLFVFMGLLWTIQFATLQYRNSHENRADSALPNVALATTLTQLWHERYHTRLAYIAGSRYLVSALVSYSPDKPTPYFSFNYVESPWINDSLVREQGALVVLDRNNHYAWDKESLNITQVEKDMQQHFPHLAAPMRIEVPRLSKKANPIVIWVTFIPPYSS